MGWRGEGWEVRGPMPFPSTWPPPPSCLPHALSLHLASSPLLPAPCPFPPPGHLPPSACPILFPPKPGILQHIMRSLDLGPPPCSSSPRLLLLGLIAKGEQREVLLASSPGPRPVQEGGAVARRGFNCHHRKCRGVCGGVNELLQAWRWWGGVMSCCKRGGVWGGNELLQAWRCGGGVMSCCKYHFPTQPQVLYPTPSPISRAQTRWVSKIFCEVECWGQKCD